MSSQLLVFQFQSSYEVRIQLINNEPYFCLKDVCLSLDIKNVSQLASQLDIKGISKTYTHTNGGKQELIFINEPNLYRVIFRSNKPEAKQFQDWVFNDVLPTIRKTGKYLVTDKSNYITSKQLHNLKLIVNDISNAYFYEESFTQGVWKMIRDIVGVDSIQHISKDKLHLLIPELEKVMSVTRAYLNLRKDTESAIIKGIFRNQENQDIAMFNIKYKHAHFLSDLNRNHQIKLDNFSKKLLLSLN